MRKRIVSSTMALLLAGIMGISSVDSVVVQAQEMMPQTESESRSTEQSEQDDSGRGEEVLPEQTGSESESSTVQTGSESESSTEQTDSGTVESTQESETDNQEKTTETESAMETDTADELEEETTDELETEMVTEEVPKVVSTFQVPTDITDAPDASPLIVTENVPGTVSGKRLTYTEIYNNSDATINLGEYTFYYQYPTGGGKVWNTGDFQMEPGKAVVLWQCDDAKYEKGQDVAFFNEYYGTDLVEGRDIIRINYTGIHATSKRGFAFGRDERSIIAYAETNSDGTDITDKNAGLAVQYSYSGHGITSYKAEVSKATPGTVENWQVPSALVHYESEPRLVISDVEGPEQLEQSESEITVTAQISGNQGICRSYLHYMQPDSDRETIVEMTQDNNSTTVRGSIPRSAILNEEIKWYVEATYGGKYTVRSETRTTTLKQEGETDCGNGPFIVTEVVTPPSPTGKYEGNSQFSYVELYNRTTSPVNFSYYKFFYEYTGTTTADKTWMITDPATIVEPGGTLVVWLTNNGNTVEDFNAYYGTDLELGKNIAIVSYAGFHNSSWRTLKFGRTADSIFATASFNENNKATIDRTGKQSIQYTYPRTADGRSTIVSTDTEPTPGTVEEWQVPKQLITFEGYEGYPQDNGEAPTLKLHDTCPESIMEGDELNVTFDVADSMGIVGTRLYYRLDDETNWNVITATKQRVSYYYFAKISADVLFGHDKVEFYVQLYNNYRGSTSEHYTVRIDRLNQIDDIRLSVEDGSILRGVTTITANDGTRNQQTELYMDGKKVNTRPMLENGAYFEILSTDRDSYFKNAVTAPYGNDKREIISYLVKWAMDADAKMVPIDSKYFNYDEDRNIYEVTLTVWAGDSGTPFEDIYIPDENHEDYTVSHLKLHLANGNEYLPVKIGPDDAATKNKTNLSTMYTAAHKVGDSAGMCTRLEASFEIPADEVTAVGYKLDTTKMEDGKHVVKAVSGDKTVSREFIVDNTKPVIEPGIEENQQVTGTLNIDPVIRDEYGINKTSILLDGEEIAVPYSQLVRKMKQGEHVLTVIAEDKAGNVEQANVIFIVNAVNPVIDAAQASNIGEKSAALEVTLQDVNAEDAKITYYKGRTLTVENGEITVCEGEGDTPLAFSSLNTSKEVTAPTGDLPYFLYTIRTGEIAEDDSVYVNWDGMASYADESHAIKMYVLNRTENRWELIGTPDENGSIHADFTAKDRVENGETIVLVQCRAQASNPTTRKDTAAKNTSQTSSSWDGTKRPDKYDFALAWITDTQFYSESYPEHYMHQNQWIVDHAKEWKIPYVIHTGDIVDEYDMIGQWQVADKAMKIFDDAGLEYGVLAGNHDVAAGRLDYQNYWNYFGKNRYQKMDCYGGNYRDNAGHYDLISQCGQDLILLYMSWDIYTSEINWMNKVLAQYPDRKAIILLHRYTNVKEKDGTYLDYAGKVLKEQVVKKNSNVIAVLNGHYHGSSFETTAFDDDGDGIKERTVYQICTDYQSAFEGGEEYIKFLYFDLENNKIYMNSYSPMHDDFNYYDTPKYDSYAEGAKGTDIDIFELDVNFDTTQKKLTCDQFSAGIRSTQKLGTAQVNDLQAEMNWNGLQPDTRYSWYAVAENNKGGMAYSDIVTFRTSAKATVLKHEDTNSGSSTSSASNDNSTSSAHGTASESGVKKTAPTVQQPTVILPEQSAPLQSTAPESKEETLTSGKAEASKKVTGQEITGENEQKETVAIEETPKQKEAELIESSSDNTQQDQITQEEQKAEKLSQNQDTDTTTLVHENGYIFWLIVIGLVVVVIVFAGVVVQKAKDRKED